MPSTDQTARETALLALSACERQGAWSDGFLKKTLREAGLDADGIVGLIGEVCGHEA